MVKPAPSHSSPGTPVAGPSVKRKKEDEEINGGVSKKPRTRVSYSCGECHRRKQKCDRQVPCSHCVARKVPELCKAYQPGKSDQDLHMRIARLERIVETALPQFCQGEPSMSSHVGSSERQRSSSSGPEDDTRSQTDEQETSIGTFQSGKWYGTSASGSVAPASVLEQLQSVVNVARETRSQHGSSMPSPELDPVKVEGGFKFSGVSSDPLVSSGAATSIIESVRHDSERSAADNLKSLVQDCGVSPHKISELLHELPPQRFSDVLIDFYFTSINWTRYPLSEREFRAAYSSMCTNGVGMNPNDVRFLPLLFVVLAIAVRMAPDHIAGDARTRRLTSLRYYWSCRRSVLIAAAIQPDSLEMVLTRLLSARFLTFDRRITECWSQLGAAVRTAQALGLHRDGAALGLESDRVEHRRRIWAYLYHADRSYALQLGRPNAVQDDYTSTLPPMNIEDETTASQVRVSPPLSSPTRMTFVILRHGLASIIGRMVHHFQQVRTPSHYSDVLALDDELLKFVHTLPPHYSMEPDTSLDKSHPFIAVHRYLLTTEILFVRISLHRPYLLRVANRYSHSRKACFDSAIKDFQVRQAFKDSISKDTRDSLSNAYREFQTAMISGIYLVLDPHGKEANAMHAILDSFLQDHEGLREMDETTRRELKIIEFLKTKSLQVEANESKLQQQQPTSRSPVMTQGHVRRPSYPLTLNTASPLKSPPAFTNSAPPSARLPAHQRVQQVDGYQSSPTASGSPGAEDESSTAQSLLDNWCNIINTGSGIDQSMSWAGGPWSGSAGNTDMSGWMSNSQAPLVGGSDLNSGVPGLDGSDWNYWETLVNQIRGAPAP